MVLRDTTSCIGTTVSGGECAELDECCDCCANALAEIERLRLALRAIAGLHHLDIFNASDIAENALGDEQ